VRITQNPFSSEYDSWATAHRIFTKPGIDKYRGNAFFEYGMTRSIRESVRAHQGALQVKQVRRQISADRYQEVVLLYRCGAAPD